MLSKSSQDTSHIESLTRSFESIIESYDTLSVTPPADTLVEYVNVNVGEGGLVRHSECIYRYYGHHWEILSMDEIKKDTWSAYRQISEDLTWYQTCKDLKKYIESAYFWRFVEHQIYSKLTEFPETRVSLDKNQGIVCFSNGVYDFNTLEFRHSKSTDYFRHFIEEPYIEPSLDALNDLHDVLNHFFKRDDKQHFLDVLSISLRGNDSQNEYTDTIFLQTGWNCGTIPNMIKAAFGHYYALDKLERNHKNIVGLDKINKRLLELRNAHFEFDKISFEVCTSRSERQKPYTVLYRSDLCSNLKTYIRHERSSFNTNIYSISPQSGMIDTLEGVKKDTSFHEKLETINFERLYSTFTYVLIQNYKRLAILHKPKPLERLCIKDIYLSSHSFWIKECGCECCIYQYVDIHKPVCILIPFISTDLVRDLSKFIQELYLSI
jgi:hypothetical protein